MNSKLTKRIGAYLLDVVFIYLFISLIIGIKFINPTYKKYEEASNKYSELLLKYSNEEISIEDFTKETKPLMYKITRYGVAYSIVSIFVIIGYFGMFQKYNHGQTLGKKIMRIKVISFDNKEVSLGKYILRLLPMYYVFVGNIIIIIMNSIFVFILKEKTFYTFSEITTYLGLGICIVNMVMIIVREDKKGLQDLLAKTKVVSE